jgi:Flp pilus assembly protein TadB
MTANLLIALASLVLWVVLAFIRPVGLGIVHLQLVAGAVFVIRWWAKREEPRQQSTVNGQR